MTAACSAGAASHGPWAWPQMQWGAVHRKVRRLQARIVQATKAGRWGKVQALQHLLTHSFSGRAFAVKRVTEHQGKRTPGVDGATWPTLAKKHKSAQWIARRDFRPYAGRHSVFAGEVDGKRQYVFQTTELRFKRHVKITGEANPYDPAWARYVEKRLGVKLAENLRGQRGLLRLWKEQNGIWPVCTDTITEVTGWHNHHIIWRSLGGTDRLENRVLLHPNCHQQGHCQQRTVTTPRPVRGDREA
jgi:RNA-directed DNA polymerase